MPTMGGFDDADSIRLSEKTDRREAKQQQKGSFSHVVSSRVVIATEIAQIGYQAGITMKTQPLDVQLARFPDGGHSVGS